MALVQTYVPSDISGEVRLIFLTFPTTARLLPNSCMTIAQMIMEGSLFLHIFTACRPAVLPAGHGIADHMEVRGDPCRVELQCRLSGLQLWMSPL